MTKTIKGLLAISSIVITINLNANTLSFNHKYNNNQKIINLLLENNIYPNEHTFIKLKKELTKTKIIDGNNIPFIEKQINNGSNRDKKHYLDGMPGGMVSTKEAKLIANYLINGGEKPKSIVICYGCHGNDGKGMSYVAPSFNPIKNISLPLWIKKNSAYINKNALIGINYIDFNTKTIKTISKRFQKSFDTSLVIDLFQNKYGMANLIYSDGLEYNIKHKSEYIKLIVIINNNTLKYKVVNMTDTINSINKLF